MKSYFKIFIALSVIFVSISIFKALPAIGVDYAASKSGLIYLQVQAHGEAWYVYPNDGKRYFLGRPADALLIMKRLSLGATSEFIANNETFPTRLSGRILLDVQKNGEAYYIYPKDLRKYYLGRPADAFSIMRQFGVGITDKDLSLLPVGHADAPPINLPAGDKIVLSVPFVSQAPFGDWKDQRQQDGCEESSALMAVSWARGESLTKDIGLKQILASSDYTQKTYGEYRDISAQDTLDWIIKDYFNYHKAIIRHNVKVEDIIDELKKGNLIVAPMNGQLLHNPNYTAPGPARHMLVIRGYDPATKTFITNDPGTRLGDGYKYDAKTLYDSIRDYKTGYHELINTVEKTIIVVSK